MEIIIKSKNLQVSEALKSYIEKKVNKLDRYLPNIEGARVDLAVQSAKSAQDRQVAQITLHTANGAFLRAEERTADMRSSLDIAIEKMERQAKRYKGKHWQSQTRPEAELPEIEDEDEDTVPGEVVRIKRFETRPMDVEEAIEQMELLGHDFFIFHNVSENDFSVIYRRRDGDYGLLLPELT